jgi:hypothetical protein
MKLRIHNNSVRIRLSQKEVALLAAGERVTQTTTFPNHAALSASIESSAHAVNLTATFDRCCIAVVLPLGQTIEWANSDRVSMETDQRIEGERSLRILVEKDFQCLHARIGDDADAFPNPADR